MNPHILTSSILLALIFAQTSALNCTGVTTIESEGILNYLVNTTFTVPKALDGDWTLDMESDVPFTFLGGWGVWVNSIPEEGRASFRSRLENATLAEGDQVSFRFRISWFKGEQRPLISSLKWEGIQLCSEFKDSVEPVKALRRRRGDNRARHVNYRKRYYVNL